MVEIAGSGQEGGELREQGVSPLMVKSQIPISQVANEETSKPLASHKKYWRSLRISEMVYNVLIFRRSDLT